MTIDQARAQVKSSVWQGIAQSGVNMGVLSANDQNKLVDSVTNSVLTAMNNFMEGQHQATVASAAPAIDLGANEQVLWHGRPFLSLNEYFELTTERIKIVRGMIGKDIENVELIRVQDIDVSQNLSERIFNIGDIRVRGADLSNPEVILNNITDPQGVYEIMRKAWLAARKRYGLQFREQM